MKTQNEFLQLIRATREYAAIAAFYGERKAERSQVPLMRHIEEGCAILWEHAHVQAECNPQTDGLQDALARAALAARAYCLHPLFQADTDLLTAGHHIVSQCDPRMVMLAMEYRARANDWLSDKVVLKDGAPVSQGAPDAGVLAEVHLMLVADKVQNHKDFAQHHRGTHARSAELEHYFQHWLQVLGVGAVTYERLTAAAAQVGDAAAVTSRTCRTCAFSHVKYDAFPCRSCMDKDRWTLARKDPWPMFPTAAGPWTSAEKNGPRGTP